MRQGHSTYKVILKGWLNSCFNFLNITHNCFNFAALIAI